MSGRTEEESKILEARYKKLTTREHVLLRPDMYVGVINPVTAPMWVGVTDDVLSPGTNERGGTRPPNNADVRTPCTAACVDEDVDGSINANVDVDSDVDMEPCTNPSPSSSTTSTAARMPTTPAKKQSKKQTTFRIAYRDVTYSPGFYKCVDEVIQNPVDHVTATKHQPVTFIKVDIDRAEGKIMVHNNGDGLPVHKHSGYDDMYIPEMVFANFRSGTNFNDDEERQGAGRNGTGAKLTFTYSTRVEIETSNAKDGKSYKQVFEDNLATVHKPKLGKARKKDYTKITFWPDFARFGMANGIDDDTYSLLVKRVLDIAMLTPRSVKVWLNGEKLALDSFETYAKLYPGTEGVEGDDGTRIDGLVYQRVNANWDVAVLPRPEAMEDCEQVSFVNGADTKDGGTHVRYLAKQIADSLLPKIIKKTGTSMKLYTGHVADHMFMMVRAVIPNPTFTSQTKDELSTRPAQFGSSKPELNKRFLMAVAKSSVFDRVVAMVRRRDSRSLSKVGGTLTRKKPNVPKLQDANYAGRPGKWCQLMLTEGDSALALALKIIAAMKAHDTVGAFPLKGKVLNVRANSMKKAMDNAEIQNLMKILGLRFDQVVTDVRELRYQSIIIMTDQDHDGSHIKGLLINLFECFWPSLLRTEEPFIKQFITPIVRVTRRKTSLDFFTLHEYKAWTEEHGGEKGWVTKYYKGLGTSTSSDAKQYSANFERHLLSFPPATRDGMERIDLAFNKDRANDRKEWLRGYRDDIFMDYSVDRISYADFVDKELIQFSMADTLRSLPSALDGLKVSQRKILYGCFKRNLTQDIKVAQLAGYVSEHSAYHHGEKSLCDAIVGMAQTFVGARNVNFLHPSGMFGTRAQGGKDAASPRYIFTRLTEVARAIFPAVDNALLPRRVDDGDTVEPLYYLPVVPMAAINPTSGIGTGFSNSMPGFHYKDVIAVVRDMIRGETVDVDRSLRPWQRGFLGEASVKGTKVVTRGLATVNGRFITVTELPVGMWTMTFKEHLDKHMKDQEVVKGKGKNQKKTVVKATIRNYEEHHTMNHVKFVIEMNRLGEQTVTDEASAMSFFKLENNTSLTNMHFFDVDGALQKYDSVLHLIRAYFPHRLALYETRRAAQLAALKDDMALIQDKHRFITLVVEKQLVIAKRPKEELETELETVHGFARRNGAYDHLLGMKLWSLTAERLVELEAETVRKTAEYEALLHTSAQDLWLGELDAVERVLDEMLEHDREEEAEELAGLAEHGSSSAASKKKRKRKRKGPSATAQKGKGKVKGKRKRTTQSDKPDATNKKKRVLMRVVE